MTEQNAETYDPSTGTVDEVNAYLDEHPEQREAVLAAEAEGENRKGIVEGPHAQTETKAETFDAAAEKATEPEGEHYQKGYIGFVPSRDGDNPVDLTLAGVTGQKES